MQYKANSVVYFKGDLNEKVYILKSGKVSLQFTDIETGQEIHDLIKTGEFFGVKSALGRYPREENAVVLQDSTMIVFTVPEFEAVASKNTRIIMKMLKVFSDQLRRIHKQVQNLISAGKQETNPEEGLFRIGEYYLKNKRYAQALYALRRYLTFYPSGKFANEATENISYAERYIQTPQSAPQNTQSNNSAQSFTQTTSSTSGNELTPAAKQYYDAVSL